MAVATRAGSAYASFGQFVRAEAARRAIKEERESLQVLGERLISDLGCLKFCRSVLDSAGWRQGSSVVVDGVRHVAILEAIRDLVAPLPVRLVFVEVAHDVREQRALKRGASETSDLMKAESHSTERDVREALRSRADRIVDGSRSLEGLADEIDADFFRCEQ